MLLLIFLHKECLELGISFELIQFNSRHLWLRNGSQKGGVICSGNHSEWKDQD